VKRFNMGERKAALQEMCEIVEGETGRPVKKLATKSWISASEEDVEKMNWSARINVAFSASRFSYGAERDGNRDIFGVAGGGRADSSRCRRGGGAAGGRIASRGADRQN
jgi:hypothetical protein